MSADEAAKAINLTLINYKLSSNEAINVLNSWNEINFVSPYAVMHM
jgi:hypothetical protein